MQSVDKLQLQVETLSLALSEAKTALAAAQDEMNGMTPEQRIAIRLHDTTCRWNHTDGCGWFYEFKDKQHDWSGSSHKSYLEKAFKLINRCGGCARAEAALDASALLGGL